MISISILLFAVFFAAHAVHRDAPWTVRLIPSDTADDFEGKLEIVALFKDGKEHAVTLPSTKFEKGRSTIFKIGLISSGPLQMVYLRTHGSCPLDAPASKYLRLRQIDLESLDANTTYTKVVNDLAIKDACQSSNKKSLGTALKDLEEYNSDFCFVEGQKYADGEQFDMGCVAKCTCQRGRFGCVDMCPPVAWSAEQKCHYVHVPGRCCDAVRCEDDEHLNSCDVPVPKSDDDDEDKAPVRRFPWSVLVCVDSRCSQVYGGVIIGSRHILLYGPDLTSFPNIRFIAGQYIADVANTTDFSHLKIVNITSHPDFDSADSPIADSASRLQLLQVDQLFTFDKRVQAANLPFNSDQCGRLSKQSCPTVTIGWDRTDDQDPSVRQWFLHLERTSIDRDACLATNTTRGAHARPSASGPRRRGEKRLCISGLTRTDCTGPWGGAVVSNRGAVDFLVGLLDPDNALFPCRNKGTAAMLPLCKYADWIQSVTTEGNY